MHDDDMHELIAIQKQETDKLRDRMHTLCNEVATMQTIVYKLDKKTVCEAHSDFSDVIKVLTNNTIEINTKLTAISTHVAESKEYREKTIRHEVELSNLKGVKELVQATLVTVIIAILAAVLKTTLYK